MTNTEQNTDVSRSLAAGDLRAAVEHVLAEMDAALNSAYNSAVPVCCGRAGEECCGSPDPSWNAADTAIMETLGPIRERLFTALKTATPPQPTEQAVAFGNDGLEWPKTFDGMAWAIEFNKRFPAVPVDDALGWFCNAIMRGYDSYAQKHPQPSAGAVTEAMVEVSAICMSDAWHEGEVAWADLNENVKTTFRTMARDSLTAALQAREVPSAGGATERMTHFVIPEQDGLDPVRVILIDHVLGKGTVIVQCYNEAWTTYFGAMSGRTLEQFIASVDSDYLGNALRVRNNRYGERIASAVIRAVRDRLTAAREVSSA